MVKPFQALFAPRLYKCYKICSCARSSHVAKSWLSFQLKKIKNKNCRYCSSIKSTCVSPLTGSVSLSVTQNDPGAVKGSCIQTHFSLLTQIALTPKPQVYIALLTVKKMVCHVPGKVHQNFWLQPFINTYYWIGLRLDLKYFFHSFFAKCSLSSSLTSEKWELWPWNLGEIFKIKLKMIGKQQNKLFWVTDFSKKLKLKIDACPVNTGLFMTFKHSFSYATVLAAIGSELCQRSFPSFCT